MIIRTASTERPSPSIPNRIAGAFAVLRGRYGNVTARTKDGERSRQSLYRGAEQVVAAVDGAAAQAKADELRRRLDEQQAGIYCDSGK